MIEYLEMDNMLENFEIKNYKCFKDFKVDKLSKINIISGDNNVGKTALLESILLIKNSSNIRDFIQAIVFIFENRDLTSEDINEYLLKINLAFKYNGSNLTIQYKFIDDLNDNEFEKMQRYTIDDFIVMYNNDIELQIVPFNGIKGFKIIHDKSNLSFIDSSKPNNTELTKLYSKI